MCSCKQWIVSYPDGRPEEKFANPTLARIAASKVPGATWKREP